VGNTDTNKSQHRLLLRKAQWQPEQKQVRKCPAAKQVNAQGQVANTLIQTGISKKYKKWIKFN
jgi:hypothetical protein